MKTRLSIINYSNTIPFSYGLIRNKKLQSLADFSYGYPSQVAELLCSNQVDVSIISVGAIPIIPQAKIVSNFCISATQRVDSVLLCSNNPLDSVQKITLDYQSRTTNILVQVLAKYAWNINPIFEMGKVGYELENDDSARVIIGDRALTLASQFEYVYDLASEWHKTFGLPFVFAAWVANKPLPTEFISELEESCAYGVQHIDDAIANCNRTFPFDITDYLHHSVEFNLTDEKRAVIEIFFEKARSLNLL